MNQDEVIAKLTPAIGLRRQLDPRAAVKPVKYSGQILRIRPFQPAEQTFSDETLDTIMVEHEPNRWHEHPAGLLAASRSAIALTWFPGETANYHPPARRGHQRPDRPADILCPDLRRHNATDHSRHQHGESRRRLERRGSRRPTTEPFRVRRPNT